MRWNNWFAMKAGSRNHHISTGKGGYCIYATVDASLADYGDYEKQIIKKYGLASEEAYRRHIIRHYAEDPDYSRKLSVNLAKHTTTNR